uniref:Uncharacterized protein n=1 Tax=Myotis myotis TaxID=51298 RepID=A0A7J7TIP7_MYOMY|nr:hypothetical protein mMyoMyo1_009052 [Myotis myotis]
MTCSFHSASFEKLVDGVSAEPFPHLIFLIFSCGFAVGAMEAPRTPLQLSAQHFSLTGISLVYVPMYCKLQERGNAVFAHCSFPHIGTWQPCSERLCSEWGTRPGVQHILPHTQGWGGLLGPVWF